MRSSLRLPRAILMAPMLLSTTWAVGAADDPGSATPQAPVPFKVYPSIPPKSTPQVTGQPGQSMPYRSQGPASLATPQNAGAQAGSMPYQSQGPASLTSIPTPQSMGIDPSRLPAGSAQSSPAGGSSSLPVLPKNASAQSAAGYVSSGPPSITAMTSGQSEGVSGSGQSYLGGGGSMNASSPYESTAAPGTSSPFAPASGSGAGAGTGAGANAGTGAGFAPGGAADPGSGGAASSGLGGIAGGAPAAFSMIGDASPPIGRAYPAASNPQTPPGPKDRSSLAPSVRGFKIAENQSPVPQDRFFFSFNYYNDVNKKLDTYFQAPIRGIEIYRYVFGYEKTFNQGMGSIGIRLPIDNVFARSKSSLLNQGGNATAPGNVTVYFKHIFAINKETGSLASGGVAISPQSASGHFGGAKFLAASNSTTIQPYFAYLFNRDRFYLQGFTAIDVPADPAQPTLIYNDIGMGYFVYRDNTSTGLITAIAPTFEVHVNSPINHTGAYNPYDKNGTPDIVNLTSGLNTRIRQNSILTMGAVVPVTGPRPFSIEATVLFNYYFGRSRRVVAPPIIGG